VCISWDSKSVFDTIDAWCKREEHKCLTSKPNSSLYGGSHYSWLMSGIWDELEVYKEVLCEMRGNKDFLPTIQAYYSSVRQCELGMSKGPLLFAIMRGKVSEGLDFADNRARGVITVSVEMTGIIQYNTIKYKAFYCKIPESQELYAILASQTCKP
jgi:hypothetical protein